MTFPFFPLCFRLGPSATDFPGSEQPIQYFEWKYRFPLLREVMLAQSRFLKAFLNPERPLRSSNGCARKASAQFVTQAKTDKQDASIKGPTLVRNFSSRKRARVLNKYWPPSVPLPATARWILRSISKEGSGIKS